MKEGYLGVDVGLSGARAVIISSSGRILSTARVQLRTADLSPLRLSKLVDRLIKQVIDGRTNLTLAAIAICAFGPAPIFLDREGHVLKFLPLHAKGADDGQSDLVDDLEARVAAFKHQENDVYRQARMVCDVTGYLVSRLTGHIMIDNITAEDFGSLSLPKSLALPREAGPLEQAGLLSPKAAKRLGLPAGIHITVGCYDSTADLALTGFGRTSKASIIIGSTLVLGALTETRTRDHTLRSTRHLGKGWFSGGWTNCAGITLALGENLMARGRSRRSSQVPLLLPYFCGERAPIWSHKASGLIAGLTVNTTPADVRRAFLEGVVLSAADIAGRLEADCGAIKQWTVTGGGTSNVLLMTELADALGAKLNVLSGANANLGPALLAARSCGLDLRRPIKVSIHGRMKKHEEYRDKLRVYRRLYAAVAPLMGDIARVTRQKVIG